MTRTARFSAVAAALVMVGAAATPIAARLQQRDTYDKSFWAGMRYRNIGPARGGRVTTVTGVPSQPRTFYMGSTGGGVWKTEDAGITWVPVSDGQITSTGSIGSIDVAPSNPNHVWVGTGSAAIRSNVILGRGVYKSLDAGKTWQFMGLKESGQIGGIKVHDDYSLVEVPEELSERIIEALRRTKIRGNKVTIQSKPSR